MAGTAVTVETESDLTPLERAQARDGYVRQFERQFSDWTEIAKVCIEVEHDQDYKLLGFHSWNAWLLDAAPRSRSYIYLVVGRYKELNDIPEEKLAQMPLGSAGILKQLSPAVRKDPEVIEAAQESPKALRKCLEKEYPMQHIEPIVEQRLRFTMSQWNKIESAWEAYKVVDPTASLEVFFEWLVSECQ